MTLVSMMTKKEKARNRYLLQKYGLSLIEYEERLALQNWACDLCQRHEDTFKNSLAVDHNHKSGVVRGLVCYSCNKFKIGRNNLETATKLYQYMQRYENGPEGNRHVVPSRVKRRRKSVRKKRS